MATKTTRYQLIKPDQDDFYNVDDFNSNADTIDEKLGEHEDKSVVSEAGSHDIRFYNNKLSVRDNGVWRDAQIFATVRVAVPSGAVVKATHDNHTRVATAVDGYAYIEVNYRGLWTFVATYQTGVSETVTKDIQSNEDVDITLNFTVLSVQVREDTTTTCNGESRYSSVATTHVFYLPSGGTYDVTMTMYGYDLKDTVTVASGTTYQHSMLYTIYGYIVNEESTDGIITNLYDAAKYWGQTAVVLSILNFPIFNRIRPFARNASGKIVPLSLDNYTVQDSTVTGYDPDYQVDITSKDEVFLFVPRMGYSHKTKDGSVGLVITDYLNDDGSQFSYAPWSLDSEGDCDGIGIGVYPYDIKYPVGSSRVASSLSGKRIDYAYMYTKSDPYSHPTVDEYFAQCTAKGDRFGPFTYWQYRFLMKIEQFLPRRTWWSNNPGIKAMTNAQYPQYFYTGTQNLTFIAAIPRSTTNSDALVAKVLGVEGVGGHCGTPLDGLIRNSYTNFSVKCALNGTYTTKTESVGEWTANGYVKYWDLNKSTISYGSSSTYYQAYSSPWSNGYFSTLESTYYNFASIGSGVQSGNKLSNEYTGRVVMYFKKGEWKLW